MGFINPQLTAQMDANLAKRLFIHAVNIHNGGGRKLLSSLLANLPTDRPVILLADTRFNLDISPHAILQVKKFRGTIVQRFLAELWLLQNVKPDDHVLCFGNLPPLFNLEGFISDFVQNRYLIDPTSFRCTPLRLRLRLSIERFWLVWRGSSIDQFIVQTPTMLNLMKRKAKKWKVKVNMLPFSNQSKEFFRAQKNSVSNGPSDVDFVYVASGEAHKNHSKLIEAWCLLAKEGHFPSLWLTISEDNDPQLCSFIAKKIKVYKLRVQNLGVLLPAEIYPLYKKATALIYPSLFESFGLPLIEARQAGILIVASELDYVRDIVDPDETFDPQSPVSIARAVKRFMGWPEAQLPLLDAEEFLHSIREDRG